MHFLPAISNAWIVYSCLILQELESEALQHIDDVSPPLFLQFLSLLVNDAIFLLDEAISLLAQLKNKERERDSAGGRYVTPGPMCYVLFLFAFLLMINN